MLIQSKIMALSTLANVATAIPRLNKLKPYVIGGSYTYSNDRIIIRKGEDIEIRAGSVEKNPSFNGFVAIIVIHSDESYHDFPLQNEFGRPVFKIESECRNFVCGWLKVPAMENRHLAYVLDFKNQDPVFSLTFNTLSENPNNFGNREKGKSWTLALFDPCLNHPPKGIFHTLPVQCISYLPRIQPKLLTLPPKFQDWRNEGEISEANST